jgi:hypothetical protein
VDGRPNRPGEGAVRPVELLDDGAGEEEKE